jgi:hypothetical protein
MRKLCSVFFALAALAAPTVFTPLVGHADPYAWCAAYGGGQNGGGRNCGFVTYQQCMVTIRGMGGFCEPNLFYTGTADRPVRHVRKRHYD